MLHELLGVEGADTATDRMNEYYPRIDSIDGVTYIGLDSIAGMFADAEHFARGAIGEAQIAKLRAALATIDDDVPIVVYLHHHPFDRHFTLCLRDAEALMAAMNGRYNLLLFGHKHLSETWPSSPDPHGGSRLIVAAGQTTHVGHGHHCEVREIGRADGLFTVHRRSVPV